jgi:hypothetical protein
LKIASDIAVSRSLSVLLVAAAFVPVKFSLALPERNPATSSADVHCWRVQAKLATTSAWSFLSISP